MTRNQEFQKKAHQFIPGGAHTYSRGDDQFPSNAPPVLSHGQGAHVWDADNRRFLDFGMGLRSVTVGYNYERISQAAIAEIQKGNSLTRASVTEVLAAEMLAGLIPWAEMVKFAKNGSTVTSAAVKLARAYTGKTKVIRCEQHPFFSFDDWFIGSTVMSSGVPDETSKLTLQFKFNDLDSLQRVFDGNPGQIAAVILEPATTEEPARTADGRTFLHQVQDLCRKNGAIFILDEMITGFRWHLKGAAEYYHVEPDLVTYGKGMANGFSVAALAGKRDIMSLGGLAHDRERVFLISTTHGAEMSGLGAFMETVRVYQELDVVGHIWRAGRELMDGFRAITERLGIEKSFYLTGLPCSPNFMATNRQGTPDLALRTLFAQEMIKNGVLMPWIAICYQHQATEIAATLEAAKKSLEIYARALEEGVDRYLVGPPIRPVFRKYN